MKHDRDELFFHMAASAHADDESERIEAEIAALGQESEIPFSTPILENALVALYAQQTAEQKELHRKQMTRKMMRAAGFILALGVSGTALVMSVEAWRVAVANFFIEKHAQYTAVHLEYDQQEESSGAVEITWKDAYVPTVLPEGYVLKTAKELGQSMRVSTYSNGIPEQAIRLDQLSPGINATVNTEGVPTHNVLINGNDGFWFAQQKSTVLVWHNADYVFVLSVPENIENFIEIAENVKKIE